MSKLWPADPEQHDFDTTRNPGPPLLNASLPDSELPSPLMEKPPLALLSAMLLKKLPVPPLISLAARLKPQPPFPNARFPANVTPTRLAFVIFTFDFTTNPSPVAF